MVIPASTPGGNLMLRSRLLRLESPPQPETQAGSQAA